MAATVSQAEAPPGALFTKFKEYVLSGGADSPGFYHLAGEVKSTDSNICEYGPMKEFMCIPFTFWFAPIWNFILNLTISITQNQASKRHRNSWLRCQVLWFGLLLLPLANRPGRGGTLPAGVAKHGNFFGGQALKHPFWDVLKSMNDPVKFCICSVFSECFRTDLKLAISRIKNSYMKWKYQKVSVSIS